MDEFIKLLDEHLDYLEHEILDDTIIIYIFSNRKEVICPYCGCKSSKLHSTYERSFRDLPLMGKKTRRLLDKIIDISLSVSSVKATDNLRDGIVDVGKSTICSF